MSKTKIAILVIIAAILWFLVEQNVFGAPIPKAKYLRRLETAYATNNKNYFGDKLTKDVTILLVPELKNDLGADLYGNTLCSETDTGMHCTIRINLFYNPGTETGILTLDHEMCHIKLWNRPLLDAHGEEFQVCMQEGAAMGELKDVW